MKLYVVTIADLYFLAPTKMIESLTVQPDKNDPSKIFVSWDVS